MAKVKVTHTMSTQQVNFILHSPGGPVARNLIKRGVRVAARARRNLGGTTGSGPRRIDTGLLRASIHTNLLTGGQWLAVRVGSGQYYALWVHDGTGIYGPRATPIKPKTAKYLKFKWKKMGNRTFYFKSVKGMKANPYLKNALPAASLKVPG